MIKLLVGKIIDFFYPPFRKIFDKQTFSYLACGGFNTALDIFLFFISYNYILHQQPIHLGLFTVSAYVVAFLMSFSVTFPLGFILSSSVVFTNSDLKRKIQLFRYVVLVAVCLLLNYIVIKFFVEYFHVYPTIAKVYTTVIVVIFSYITQKNFTFRKSENVENVT